LKKPDLLSAGALGLACFMASALIRYHALAQTPFANGWDSYYYLVQLKSLEESGRMHSPEASLIYPFLQLCYRLTGDYVLALKAGAAVLAGLFAWVVFTVPKAPLSGKLAGAAFALFSPTLTYFAAQYPKNLLGLVLLAAFIGSLSRVGKEGQKGWQKEMILPLTLLVINYFGHRATFALGVIWLALWFLFRYKENIGKQVLNRRFAAVFVTGLVLLAAASRVFPGLFHVVDFGRLERAFTSVPQFAPWSFVRYFGIERISGWWLVEVIVATGCWLFGLWRFFRKNGQAMAVLGVVLLFPFLEWSFTGISWRFFLIFVLLTPLWVIDWPFLKSRINGLVFAAFLTLGSFFSWHSYNPQWHDPDYSLMANVTAGARRFLSVKSAELVIAHNTLAEYFTFATGTDAMPWLPEYPVDSSRLWRIAAGIPVQTLRYYSGSEKAVQNLGFGYSLLPEYRWQIALQQAEKEQDTDILAEMRSWRNPGQIRPGWLLYRKRKY
jgi:hypothetical protein